jgi:hypothetical protein
MIGREMQVSAPLQLRARRLQERRGPSEGCVQKVGRAVV